LDVDISDFFYVNNFHIDEGEIDKPQTLWKSEKVLMSGKLEKDFEKICKKGGISFFCFLAF
jgi:hypothetical protein